MRSFLVVLLLVFGAIGAKLTDKENRQRASICGRKVPNKLHNGQVIPGSDAPWTVAIGFGQDKTTLFQSGFLISDRHVITNMEAIMWDRNEREEAADTFQFRLTGNMANVQAWCKNRTFGVSPSVVRRMGIVVCATQGLKNCISNKTYPFKSATYLGNCDIEQIAYGLVVMELKKPLDLGVVRPLCVPDDNIVNVKDNLKAYGVGRLNSGDKTSTKVNTAGVQAIPCTNADPHPNLSICTTTTVCELDNGGPVTKIVKGQEYAVASLTSIGCGNFDDPILPKSHVSVGEFSKEICVETGVCAV